MIPTEFFCRACDRTVNQDERLAGRISEGEYEVQFRTNGPLYARRVPLALPKGNNPAVIFHDCQTVLFARGMTTDDVQAVAKDLFS